MADLRVEGSQVRLRWLSLIPRLVRPLEVPVQRPTLLVHVVRRPRDLGVGSRTAVPRSALPPETRVPPLVFGPYPLLLIAAVLPSSLTLR